MCCKCISARILIYQTCLKVEIYLIKVIGRKCLNQCLDKLIFFFIVTQRDFLSKWQNTVDVDISNTVMKQYFIYLGVTKVKSRC